MTASLLLSWRDGVSAEYDGAGSFCIQGPTARVIARQLPPALLTALRELSPPGREEHQLADVILQSDGMDALAVWYYWLQKFARRGLVCRSVQTGGQRLATLLPTAPSYTFASAGIDPDRAYLLSRFAYLRREGGMLLLESPLAGARVVLDDPRAASLVCALIRPASPREIERVAADLPVEAVASLLSLLHGAGMLAELAPEASDGDAELPEMRSWEFHDLLFHARSRMGRCDAPFGATFRLAGKIDPSPALKPNERHEFLELYYPDLNRLRQDDPPLTDVLERRVSIRDYGSEPITARQLGEFLYRVARVKEYHEDDIDSPAGPVRMDFATRPYPSGGGLYELEFYVAVNACVGLAPGLYHYDARHHRLGRLSDRTALVKELLSDAAFSAGIRPESVQVQLVLAARFARLAWKYSSIAYALILKHVGVVYQTMYLTATAMNLAPCALGGGDSDLFARAAGTNYYAETSVGEFLLGGRSS
jgi:SagB-type dehydrogenase family enzyme